MRVALVTHFASPYQVELLNGVADAGRVELEVTYLHRTFPTRSWATLPLHHRAVCLDEEPSRFEEAHAGILSATLAVFNYYAERPAAALLRARVETGKPWCFWGERPGFRKPEWIGRVVRGWKLSSLHSSEAPIWGIGKWAVEEYLKEFGRPRKYFNVPYYSDLRRFKERLCPPGREKAEKRFLFSGSMSRRKGVDILAAAFSRLASEFSNARLTLMGDGPLLSAVRNTLGVHLDRVEFPGFQRWSELPSAYSRADILCAPSRYDGWNLAIPEGLASGLPVISTDRTGAALDLIQPGVNGWLVKAGSEKELYLAMREAMMLPESELANRSEHALRAAERHSLTAGVQKFIEAVEGSIESYRGNTQSCVASQA